MPKLANTFIHHRTPDDTTCRFECPTYVDSDGKFSIIVPPDLVPTAEELGKFGHELRKEIGYFEMQENFYSRGTYSSRVLAKTLKTCKDFLQKCAEEHLKCETKTERVIAYRVTVYVSFWLGKNGKPYGNGGECDAPEGSWWKPKLKDNHESRERAGVVGVAALVFDKTTHKRASGSNETFERVRNSDDAAAAKLNSFHFDVDPEQHGILFMPYTPEAAEFFVRMMESVCMLAKQLDDFFADKKRVKAVIEAGASLLLMPPEPAGKKGGRK